MEKRKCVEKSIVECLRKNSVVVYPETVEEHREKLNLIVEHQLDFPSKIQPVISAAANGEQEPRLFLQTVYDAVRAFFFGEPHQQATTSSTWWHGPDMTVDTEEQIEVAVRFFPKVLKEEYTDSLFPHRVNQIPPSKRGCHPIYLFMTCSNAMVFVPLLAELGGELGIFSKKQRGGLGCTFRGVFFQLANGTIRRDEFGGEEPQRKLDGVCTTIMVRLKDKGLIKAEDIYNYNLVNLLLYHGIQKPASVIEQRLRFLIDWDPYILKDCLRGTSLLGHFVYRLSADVRRQCPNGQTPSHVIRIFRLIVEASVMYFPLEFGFVFHGRNFEWACKIIGTKATKIAIDEEISKTIHNKRSSLQAIVFSAATNKDISLDGLYTLFRHDPMALLSKHSVVT